MIHKVGEDGALTIHVPPDMWGKYVDVSVAKVAETSSSNWPDIEAALQKFESTTTESPRTNREIVDDLRQSRRSQ